MTFPNVTLSSTDKILIGLTLPNIRLTEHNAHYQVWKCCQIYTMCNNQLLLEAIK